MPARTNKAWLDPRYLLIALLPALVFLVNQGMIATFAEPFDIPPRTIAEFDVDTEGAARIGMLATFMLFMGAALAALFFFAYTLRMFDWRGRRMAILAFLAMASSAILVPSLTDTGEAHDYSGRSLACLAAGYNKAQSDQALAPTVQSERRTTSPAPSAPANQPGASPRQVQPKAVDVARLPHGRSCRNDRFDKMRNLGSWQYLGVAFSFAGLVIGAICCLASWPPEVPPGRGSGRGVKPDPQLQHWEKQSEWLNTYLYLAALLLGTALVFINAYMRWPAYVLLDPARYHEHTAALVSYYGVVFTIMLASFYIPVATILTGKVKALKPAAQGESKLPEAFKGPLQILKIVLGLFSTALAGALPGILDLMT